MQAVKQLGVWGLFTRGLPLRIVMIGTLTGSQWGIYDAFKVFVGLYVFPYFILRLSSTVACNLSVLTICDLLELVGQQLVALPLLLPLASEGRDTVCVPYLPTNADGCSSKTWKLF